MPLEIETTFEWAKHIPSTISVKLQRPYQMVGLSLYFALEKQASKQYFYNQSILFYKNPQVLTNLWLTIGQALHSMNQENILP